MFDLDGHSKSYLLICFFPDDSEGFFVDSLARSDSYNIDGSFRGYAINYPESADSVTF